MPMVPLACMVAQLGVIMITRNAAQQLHHEDVLDGLGRHVMGDYGELEDVDWQTNDDARRHGYGIVSSYTDRRHRRFLIVTEADRSATTILLPEEY